VSANQRVARAAEPDEPKVVPEIDVNIGSVREARAPAEETDIFAREVEEFRKVNGISPTLKRAISRGNLTKFQRGTGGAETKAKETPYYVNGYNLFGVVLPPYNLDYLAALYEKSSPHAAAIRAKVKNIVGLGYDFVESDSTKEVLDKADGDEKKLQSIRRKLARGKREVTDWLDSCNEEDTFTETLIKVWTDYEATGNGFIEIGRKTNGQIGFIGHIPATTMRIRHNRDGFVQIVANEATYFRNYGDQKTKNPIGSDNRPNEVIHLKKYSPTNSFYGVSDIIPALTALVGNDFSARFNLDYFENKAVPRYVIIIKGATLSKQAEQNILEFFQGSIKGKNHRTIYVPLPPDEEGKKAEFKMEPVETGTQDSSFNNYRKNNLNEILMAHGVPITKVSAGEGITLAAARDLDKTFKEQVCRPEQDILEQKLNKVLKEITDVFKLALNELSLTDEDTQSKIDERYLRMQTVIPNEVRARMGKTGIKGGDKVVELKPQQNAEQSTQASGNRKRDQQRTANSTDSSSSTNSRAPKGEGRQQS
jgi:PBSX family phage portal protein